MAPLGPCTHARHPRSLALAPSRSCRSLLHVCVRVPGRGSGEFRGRWWWIVVGVTVAFGPAAGPFLGRVRLQVLGLCRCGALTTFLHTILPPPLCSVCHLPPSVSYLKTINPFKKNRWKKKRIARALCSWNDNPLAHNPALHLLRGCTMGAAGVGFEIQRGSLAALKAPATCRACVKSASR